MPKIVYAPILEQAGFLKRKTADVVEQWVAQLDGATQYWQLSEPIIIPANVNYEIGFYASRALNDSSLLYIFGYSLGDVQAQHRLALSSGVPQMAYGMGFVAKEFNFNGDGQFTLTHNGTSKVTFIDFNTSDFYVKVGGVEVLRIPLTNKSQGATQLATVGNVNATMINYTEAVWRKP